MEFLDYVPVQVPVVGAGGSKNTLLPIAVGIVVLGILFCGILMHQRKQVEQSTFR
jgi:hypothetical protein